MNSKIPPIRTLVNDLLLTEFTELFTCTGVIPVSWLVFHGKTEIKPTSVDGKLYHVVFKLLVFLPNSSDNNEFDNIK